MPADDVAVVQRRVRRLLVGQVGDAGADLELAEVVLAREVVHHVGVDERVRVVLDRGVRHAQYVAEVGDLVGQAPRALVPAQVEATRPVGLRRGVVGARERGAGDRGRQQAGVRRLEADLELAPGTGLELVVDVVDLAAEGDPAGVERRLARRWRSCPPGSGRRRPRDA